MEYIVTTRTVELIACVAQIHMINYPSWMHVQLMNIYIYILKKRLFLKTSDNYTVFLIHSLLTLIGDGVMKEKKREGKGW